MANDTEKVASTQESICKTIEIIGRKLLSDLQFDITETATIVNDTKKADGIYTVKSTSGTAEYEATSSDKTLSKGNVVYVTIPKGDYKEDKIIVGKKTAETEVAQQVVHAFDNLVEMVDNEQFMIDEQKGYSLVANGSEKSIELIQIPDKWFYYKENIQGILRGLENEPNNLANTLGKLEQILEQLQLDEDITNKQNYLEFAEAIIDSIQIPDDNKATSEIQNKLKALKVQPLMEPLADYTRFGIKADFCSFTSDAVTGDYGVRVILYTRMDSIESDKITYIPWVAELNTEKMFGNPYNFTGYFSQEFVWPIEGLGTIEFIDFEFYQDCNFLKDDGSQLPTNINGANGQMESITANLFVKNINVIMGYDINDIQDELVNIYTFSNKTYLTKDNKKEIKLRWVHIDETYGALDIADAAQSVIEASEEDSEADAADPKPLTKEKTLLNIKNNSKIEWFRYKLGAPSATSYSGVYWEKLKNDDKFFYILEPDINLANEQLKVIITYPKDSNNHYYSNVLVFKNEKDVSGINAGKFLSALTLKCDDDSYGNYFIYDQGRGLLDQSQSKEIKTITAHFDLEKAGDEIDSVLTEAESICWTVPADATMIVPVDEGYNTKEIRGTPDVNNNNYIEKDGNNDTIFTLIENNNTYTWTYKDNKLPERVIKDNIGTEDFTLNGVAYQRKIYFSQFEIVDGELKTQISKVCVYKEKDSSIDETKPLRIYDNINKQIFIYDYDLSSTDSSFKNKLKYQISPTYSQSNNNNTIQCSIVKDGTKYSTSKELSFGIMGTADTDYTLVLDFDDNKHAIVVDGTSTKYSCTLRLYDQSGKEVNNFVNEKNEVTWSLYSGNFDTDLEFINGTRHTDFDNNPISYSTTTPNMEIQLGTNITTTNDPTSIIVIQASVNWGDRTLIAYLPVPLTNNSDFNHIKGPTWITYLSDGSISFDNQEYKIVGNDNSIIDSEASIMSNDNKASAYLPDISEKNRLKPLSFYVEQGTTRCAIKLTDNSNSYWINPLMILQNKYPSRGVNQWDGKTLTIDNENGSIYSTMLVAGSKNSQGQFSGVMLGDMAKRSNEESLSKQTGIYGFQNGEMSYAFKEDGTAFIGKSGSGRIEFNGSSGLIESSNYSSVDEQGTSIDLGNGNMTLYGTLKANGGSITNATIEHGSINNLQVGPFSLDELGLIYQNQSSIDYNYNSIEIVQNEKRSKIIFTDYNTGAGIYFQGIGYDSANKKYGLVPYISIIGEAGLKIQGQNGASFTIEGINANNQHGIYARFA